MMAGLLLSLGTVFCCSLLQQKSFLAQYFVSLLLKMHDVTRRVYHYQYHFCYIIIITILILNSLILILIIIILCVVIAVARTFVILLCYCYNHHRQYHYYCNHCCNYQDCDLFFSPLLFSRKSVLWFS